MFGSALIASVAHDRLDSFCLLIMLLAFGFPVASAQCSQATQPEAATSAQPVASLQGNQPVPMRDDSSSVTPMNVRFATGIAITVLEGTPLQVITDVPISSRRNKAGAKISFTVTRDVVVEGILVIPCGATAFGTVVEVKQAGRLAGTSNLTLQLTALNLDGRSYPLYTPPFKVVGQSKTRPTVDKMAIGATIGGVAAKATVPAGTVTDVATGTRTRYTLSTGDQAKGITLASGVGAGVGAAIAASSPPSIALIPAESQMEFTLASPIAVYPIDQHTAARLAQGMHHGGPVLYLRGENQ
jgi:hypothetical protein